MIRFESVSKSYRVGRSRKHILKDVTFSVPRGRSLAVIGINGAGKTTMLRMMSGASLPDSGKITWGDVRVSFPLGFTGSFNQELTAYENIRFACRVYGDSIQRVQRFVEEFSELGDHLRMPVKTYSSGMRARLAFGLSMALEFDVYLIDEITAVGDATFRQKCNEVFSARLKHADIIMVSHGLGKLKKFCDMSCVLNGGQVAFYDTVDEGVEAYEQIIGHDADQ